MSFWGKIFAALRRQPKADARVTARVSRSEEEFGSPNFSAFMAGMNQIAAKFPFEMYEMIDNMTLLDPYVSKYHHSTVSLGNTGHALEINASSEARANEAIQIANDFAARCFPLSAGLDGLINSLFSQIARTGGLCVEWVPNPAMNMIEQAYLVPVKTLRFRYTESGALQLCQMQNMSLDLIPLNPVQTTFHAVTVRDGNPYPIPPALAALEPCMQHRTIMTKIKTWMDKLSALGVLLAEVQSPPRSIGESDAEYDSKAAEYLQKIARTITDNLDSGLGVAYDNVKFTFNNTSAGAQGGKDILQIVLQGMFAALQRDPVFFGWNFNSTETYAKIVYEEMVQGIKTFQLGVKRAVEHGHRLNFALQGYGDIGISVQFQGNRSVDAFRDAEADYMKAQGILAQYTAEPKPLISYEEARRLLGHDEKRAGAGEFVASFNRSLKRYQLIPCSIDTWERFQQKNSDANADESDSGHSLGIVPLLRDVSPVVAKLLERGAVNE
jgi:hypothetical protein